MLSSNPREPPLMLAHDLRLERPVPVSRPLFGKVPNIPLIVFAELPFRELSLPSPAASCFSYPTCSVIYAAIARSSRPFVSCLNSPFSPIRSSGFLYPFSNCQSTHCLWSFFLLLPNVRRLALNDHLHK